MEVVSISAILYDSRFGKTKGVLLSPLHPLRLAWCWAVQQAAEEARSVIENVSALLWL